MAARPSGQGSARGRGSPAGREAHASGRSRFHRHRGRLGRLRRRRAAVGGCGHARAAAGSRAAQFSPWVRLPAGYAKLYGSGIYDPRFMTEPIPSLNDRAMHWPRGRVLGGSGSVNGLVYLRGSPHDYDRWAQAGARGWSHDDVAPVFRRMETWLGDPSEARGASGPIQVSEPRRLAAAPQAFIDSAVAAGLGRFGDVNDGGSIEGVGAGATERGRALPVVLGAHLPQARHVAPEPGGPHRHPGPSPALRGHALRRRADRAGRVPRAARGRRELRRDRDAEAADAVGHRRRRRAAGLRHRRGRAQPRCGAQPAGPPDREVHLAHQALRDAERDPRQPREAGRHRARLAAPQAGPAGDRRRRGDRLPARHAGRGGAGGAASLRQLRDLRLHQGR